MRSAVSLVSTKKVFQTNKHFQRLLLDLYLLRLVEPLLITACASLPAWTEIQTCFPFFLFSTIIVVSFPLTFLISVNDSLYADNDNVPSNHSHDCLHPPCTNKHPSPKLLFRSLASSKVNLTRQNPLSKSTQGVYIQRIPPVRSSHTTAYAFVQGSWC